FRVPRWLERGLLSGVVGLTGAVLVLTQSRGAIIAGLGALLAWEVILWHRTLRSSWLWLVGALLAGVVALVVAGPVALDKQMLDPVVPGYATSDPANLRVRLELWSSAVAAIGGATLTG